MHPSLLSIKNGLVVSCQTSAGNPVMGPESMTLMAIAAATGGAVGFRAEGAIDIAAIRATTALPIIGIRKTSRSAAGGVFITPTFETATEMAAAGADVIALDGTPRPRPGGQTLAEIITRIHDDLGLPVMADTDSVDSGLYAEDAGADVIGTTLSGYTAAGPIPDVPDVDLVASLVARLDRPVIAEGRYWTRENVAAAYAVGAYSVVVGSAVTNPMMITRRMVAVTPRSAQ
ncbi:MULTISPECIES: N-acetylmannosamine-6-phosphate 2-epimerase [unclassified Cryobacterium]|uniref:N-acetylmannosamine-6-phosphate 2-epimerase n=1 Tax=unclassified Cryobacterium TaxID=2649013 RepID=UPI00106C4DF5|nr:MULTISPECIES: N-acetylmannosamine-6-phosphate 2-epimerase [unclassified Cryobacterium]TFD07870.1 N-acetylmannosamine-6-phosphate 2-epimerase [Cryobacterium sp. TMT1-66-1]TFD08093.1 N-acetylmannosamine-6-phosphate 2-epimerase [Cryobacterium sp. TMT1-2-2]